MAFLERNANRGSVSTGFNIDHSLKVENDNREYIRWTNFSNQGSEARKKKFSMSLWCKRTELGRQQIIWSTSQNGYLGFDAGDTVVWYQQYVGSSTQIGIRTNRKFRDVGAWYHFMIVVDTAQSTEANRVKMYVNGVQETSFGTPNTYPSQNAQASNLYEQHLILGEWGGGSTGFSGYIAEYYFLSEIAASPTDLGEYDEDSGIWKPKAYDGTISSPSHFLEFKDGSDLGTATSGLDGDYLENITAADQATDTPTNNFCTINTPFDPYVGGPPTITEGATIMTAGSSGQQDSYGTMALFKGKWYFEFSVLNVGGLAIANMFGGVVKVNRLLQSSYNNAANGHHSHDGGWGGNASAVGVHSGSVSGFTSVSGAAVDVVIGVAVDMDNGKIWWASGGTYASSSGSVSNPANGTLPQFTNLLTQYPGEPVVPAYNHYVHQATTKGAFNFGNPFDHAFTDIGTNSDANGYGSFAYTPPAGYYAICSKNLAEYG